MVEKFLPGKETNHAGGSFWEMELREKWLICAYTE